LVHEVESKTVAMVTVHPKPGIPNQAIVIGAGPVGRRVAPHLETSGHRACMLELSSGNLQPFDRQSLYTVAGETADLSVLKLALRERR
jgi:Trk K+ transport system NAD-binding subunit